MPGFRLYAKMFAAGATLCIGGPALIYYVTPTEAELFSRYNPELQRRSLENRIGKQEDFDKFVTRLKEYSKSDKPIWEAAADDVARRKAELALSQQEDRQREQQAIEQRKEEIRRHSRAG